MFQRGGGRAIKATVVSSGEASPPTEADYSSTSKDDPSFASSFSNKWFSSHKFLLQLPPLIAKMARSKPLSWKTTKWTTRALSVIGACYLVGMLVCLVRDDCYMLRDDISTDAKGLESFVRSPAAEIHVISMQEAKFNVFEQRNFDLVGESGDETSSSSSTTTTTLEMFQAYNGMDQAVLDEWSSITGLWRLDAKVYEAMDPIQRKNRYDSPHTVGCYLSHWRLLEQARKSWSSASKNLRLNADAASDPDAPQRRRKRPDMLFVFEDDADCVSNLVDRTWEVVQQLPSDWDILYLGGKPMSYYTQGKTIGEISNESPPTPQKDRPTDQQLLEQVCAGTYGTPHSGPFAPGTSESGDIKETSGATLPTNPPYWETKSILNTNAYVINPQRIRRVLRVLSAPRKDYQPIDVRLSADMNRAFLDPYAHAQGQASNATSTNNAPLKAFMTPRMYCDQDAKRLLVHRDEPADWEGFHWIPWSTFGSWPDASGYVWGVTASHKLCQQDTVRTKSQSAWAQGA